MRSNLSPNKEEKKKWKPTEAITKKTNQGLERKKRERDQKNGKEIASVIPPKTSEQELELEIWGRQEESTGREWGNSYWLITLVAGKRKKKSMGFSADKWEFKNDARFLRSRIAVGEGNHQAKEIWEEDIDHSKGSRRQGKVRHF